MLEEAWEDKTQCRHTDGNGQVHNPSQPACAEGISAVKALALAQAQGQRIYTITPSNAATALPKLPVGGEVGAEIRNAIQAGKEVTIHENPITAHGWTGYGYIIVDPETGAGAYLIEGKGNGAVIFILFISAVLLFFSSMLAIIAGLYLLAAESYVLALLVGVLMQYISGGAPNPDTAVDECIYVYNVLLSTLGVVGALITGPVGAVVIGMIAAFAAPMSDIQASGKKLCSPQQ